MLDFITQYWQYISFGLIFILDIVILIVKRVKLQFKVPQNSYTYLIEAIKEAEKIYGSGHGKEKLNYVVESYMKHFDIPGYFASETQYYVKGLIESILNTPQKKSTDD